MTTSADIVNRAVQLIGGFNDQGPITGTPPNFDGTPIGIAAGVLYAGVVQTVGRQWGFDFSRNTVALVVTGNTPPPQWKFEYAYPAKGVQIRQLLPSVIADQNNPFPIRWTVGNVTVAGTPTKVIWTNLTPALAAFTNQPPETLWDALFTEAVVRLLASELDMAIPGRPDTSREALGEAQTFMQTGEGRDS